MHAEIPKAPDLEEKVFGIHNVKDFNSIALELYHFQFHNNPVYRLFCKAVHRSPGEISGFDEIPFLPIRFFKTHPVKTGHFEPELVFKSSGTTGDTSSHLVRSARLYERSFMTCFESFYGPVKDYCIIGLLPSYLERGQSSLVYMVDRLIGASGHPQSGFYLYELDKLSRTLDQLETANQKTLLIGVSYALADFAKKYPKRLQHTLVMETGGMKGRAKEITRAELYELLKAGLGVEAIHSEYGMTELLSQAYAVDGVFSCPPWMKLVLRDETDPFSRISKGSGGINIIDLANIYSCCFIATEDLGRLLPDGRFEVLGRMDHSDVRGCSQLVI